jgi:hypothetical protein
VDNVLDKYLNLDDICRVSLQAVYVAGKVVLAIAEIEIAETTKHKLGLLE